MKEDSIDNDPTGADQHKTQGVIIGGSLLAVLILAGAVAFGFRQFATAPTSQSDGGQDQAGVSLSLDDEERLRDLTTLKHSLEEIYLQHPGGLRYPEATQPTALAKLEAFKDKNLAKEGLTDPGRTKPYLYQSRDNGRGFALFAAFDSNPAVPSGRWQLPDGYNYYLENDAYLGLEAALEQARFTSDGPPTGGLTDRTGKIQVLPISEEKGGLVTTTFMVGNSSDENIFLVLVSLPKTIEATQVKAPPNWHSLEWDDDSYHYIQFNADNPEGNDRCEDGQGHCGPHTIRPKTSLDGFAITTKQMPRDELYSVGAESLRYFYLEMAQ